MGRRHRGVLATALAAASLLRSAASTSYYISSLGDDSSPGTSAAAPWKTLARAMSVSNTLDAGDGIYLRAGDVFPTTGAWFLDLTATAGTAAHPITIGSYSDAASGADRPRIVRSDVPSHGPTVTLNNASGVVVRGLEVIGGENGIAFTFVSPSAGTKLVFDSLTVTDCFFRNVSAATYNASHASIAAAVALASNSIADVSVTNVAVTSNLCELSDVFYINSVDYAGWTRANVSGLVLANNTITESSFNTVFLDTTDHVTVAGNVFSHDTPRLLFVYGTTDIIMGTLDASNRLTGNEISYRGEYQPGGPDGCAVDFETSANGVEFSGNFVYRSFGAGIMVLGHQTTSTHLNFTWNVMLFNGCNQTLGDHGGISFLQPNSSGTIADNVFTTCPGTPVFYERLPGFLDHWSIHDNVIDGQNGTVVALPPPVVTWAYAPDGTYIVVTAGDASSGAGVLRYTLDGSRPTDQSPVWPATGNLTLPARSVAVNVKSIPKGAVDGFVVRREHGDSGGLSVVVESPSAGGIIRPPSPP